MNFRRIARYLGVSHQTVINWVNAYSAQLPSQPRSRKTWVSSNRTNCIPSSGRKKRVYLMTLVDRHSSCILAWRVDSEHSEARLQALVDEAPQAKFYYSDLFATYRTLVYSPGRYTPMPDKSQTYRVEGDNAEFRHYLARLARRSRCFSRCIQALRRAVKLFVYLWNRRQLHRQRYSAYPAHPISVCRLTCLDTPGCGTMLKLSRNTLSGS